MKSSNKYHVGWVVDKQVATLTHYVPELIPEDFMNIMCAAQNLLLDTADKIHFIVDNRVMEMPSMVSLAQMQYWVFLNI